MWIKTFFKNYFKQSQADVAIEFVFVLPVILIIFAGIYEMTMYSLAYNKLSRVTMSIGNSITKTNISQATILSYCAQAPLIMDPFDFAGGNGSIVISQVQNNGGTLLASNVKISWQIKYNSAVSKFGTVGATTGFPNGLSVTGNQAAVIVEAYYTYTPVLLYFMTVPKTIYQVNFFVPRIGQMSTLL